MVLKKTKIICSLLLILLVGIVFSGCEKADTEYGLAEEGLFCVFDGKRWGYVDNQGKAKIGFNYDYAFPFHDGLAIVKKKSGFGAIDSTGKEVIQCKFNYLGTNFSNGLCVYASGTPSHYKYGYINENGDVVIKAQYKYAKTFSEGLAFVEDSKSNKLYINTKGEQVVVANDYDNAFNYHNGLAFVGKDIGENIYGENEFKYGAIDKKGNLVIDLKYDYVDFPNEMQFDQLGYAIVSYEDNIRIIDKQENVVFDSFKKTDEDSARHGRED